MLEAYRKHVEERAAENLPPLALDAQQVAELVELIKNPFPLFDWDTNFYCPINDFPG